MSFLQRFATVVLVVGAAALAMAQIGGGGFAVVQYLSGGSPVSVTSGTPLPVTGSVTASVAGFTPNGSYATLTATGSSARVALPTGTVVVAYNTGTTAVSCVLGNGSVTATTNEDQIPAGGFFSYTVGANVDLACIDQAGSASNLIVLSGGSGIASGAGGGGALPAGAATAANQTGVQTTVAPGTAPASANVDGCVYNSSPPGPTNGQSLALQCDSAGNALVDLKTALPAGQAALGNVGALTKTVCVTPATTSATYAANVVIGNGASNAPLTFANLFTSTGHGTIQSVALNFNTAQTVGFLLFPFRTATPNTTWTDHSAASISTANNNADIFATDAPISLANPNSALGNGTNYGANGLGQAYNPAGTSGYFILVPTATTATLGGTANTVQVCVTVLQDS